MEFFSGHDIDGDGKNDIYVRHKGQGDPLVVLFLFALIALVIGLSYASFSLFSHFLVEQKDFPISLMVMSFVGSFVVVGIFVGWFCGQLGRSYSVPFGALGLFFTIGFLWVGIINREPEAQKRGAEAAELKNKQDYSKYLQKTEAIRNKIKPIQEKLIAKANSRGWSLDETPIQPLGNTEFKDNYRCWITWSGREANYSITAFAPPPLQGLTITVGYQVWNDRWTVNMSSKLDQEPRDMIVASTGWPSIDFLGLQDLKPGKLKDLANELAGYLYSLKVANDKVSKEIDQETAEELAAQQQEAKDRSNRLKGWVVGGVATGAILAIFGLVFFLKRKNKPTTQPPTPIPSQDKPAITTGQRYKYTCSGCSTRYKLTHEALGKSFPCKKCKVTCRVPTDVDQLSIE